MTTAAIRWRGSAPSAGSAAGCPCGHSLRADAVGALTLYGLYELARGLVSADRTRLGNGLGGHYGCLVLGRG